MNQIKFETINGTLCCMVEPEPLTEKSQFPCVVRLIQDDSPMGRMNKRAYPVGKIDPIVVVGLELSGEISTIGNVNTHLEHEAFEIIGYPVVDHSAEWALWMLQKPETYALPGKYNGAIFVFQKTAHGIGLYQKDKILPNEFITQEEFLANAEPTGWQLYEPEPDVPKKYANCLICGKEIKGLLDGHAEVSIKRFSISSLYESTFSHYCGKCFLEIGFDKREKEYRKQYESRPEPKPAQQYKVGDWVECVAKCRQRKLVDYLGGMGCYKTNYGEVISPSEILRKLDHSNVVIRIGCLSGTVMANSSPYKETDAVFFLVNDDCDESCCIPFAMLDEPTLSLVKDLLEKQKGEIR